MRPRSLPCTARTSTPISAAQQGVRPRLRFFVYPSNERIEAEGLAPEESLALVEVVEIISTRLASLRVLRTTGEIKPGDRLELAEGE